MLGIVSSIAAGQQVGVIEYIRGNVKGLPVNTRGYLQLRDDNLAAFHTAHNLRVSFIKGSTIESPIESWSHFTSSSRPLPHDGRSCQTAAG